MKKYFLFTAAIVASSLSYAQKAYSGLWEGKLNIGVEMSMVFKISLDADQKITATLEVPDQGIKDVKVNVTYLVGDSLKFEITKFGATYTGKLVNDSLMLGRFEQQMSMPLQLKKVQQIVTKLRPQTPVAPFSYKSEDIIYTNVDKSIQYGATITIPNGKGPFPAAMLLTGSGQQNRDEEVLGHKPFAVIADHLTKNGFIVLRTDDRGMGVTTGDVESATTYDFAKDAIVSLDYLLSRKEVDKHNIGFIGHSEGGMIAQLVAAERPEVQFIISLAGPGAKTVDLMNEQNRLVLSKMGMPQAYVDKYALMYNALLETTITHDEKNFKSGLLQAVNKWIEATPADVVMFTTGIKDEASKNQFINQSASMCNTNWFRYFIKYDPAENLKNFKGHYLALNGDKDIQVVSKSNLAAIEKALKNGKTKSYEIHELKGLNHLFQECVNCTIQEYGKLDQTISPQVLDIMLAWLKKIALK